MDRILSPILSRLSREGGLFAGTRAAELTGTAVAVGGTGISGEVGFSHTASASGQGNQTGLAADDAGWEVALGLQARHREQMKHREGARTGTNLVTDLDLDLDADADESPSEVANSEPIIVPLGLAAAHHHPSGIDIGSAGGILGSAC